MEHIGVNSLPLVLIIAVFTGAVSAWQAAYQLKGCLLYTSDAADERSSVDLGGRRIIKKKNKQEKKK